MGDTQTDRRRRNARPTWRTTKDESSGLRLLAFYCETKDALQLVISSFIKINRPRRCPPTRRMLRRLRSLCCGGLDQGGEATDRTAHDPAVLAWAALGGQCTDGASEVPPPKPAVLSDGEPLMVKGRTLRQAAREGAKPFPSLLHVPQHGQGAPLAVPEVGSCACSGRAW